MKKTLALIFALCVIFASTADARPRRSYDGDEEPDPQQLIIQVNKPVLDFEAPDLGGTTIKTKDFRKDKVFILHISNTKVQANKHDIAVMKNLADKYAGKVAVLDVVSKDESTVEEILEYYELINVNFTPVIDGDGKVMAAYGMIRLPLFIIADKTGNVIHINEGCDPRMIDYALERIMK